MQAPRPHRPWPVRLANLPGRLGLRRPSLDEDALLSAACRRTGLDDPGDPAGWQPGLRALLAALEGEARLTTLGRVMARSQIVALLAARLRVRAHRRRHPRTREERIEAPLFVVGLPRTGTTLLHGVLAQDPAHRAPLSYEVRDPFPPLPPPSAQDPADPRIAAADRELAGLERLAPGFQAIHPMGALLPQECVAFQAMAFWSMQFEAAFQVPSYQRWLEAQDPGPAYAWHRLFLQHLQSGGWRGRWVLKTPAHLLALDTLFAVYPDAVVVQTHRDPVEVVASVSSLECTLRGASTDAIDPVAIGREQVRTWAVLLERGLAARDRLADREARFVDVRFPELLADPLGAVRRLYARLGRPLTAEAETRMRAFLAAHARDKHGTHRYALEAFGLEREATARAFGAYRRRFGLDGD